MPPTKKKYTLSAAAQAQRSAAGPKGGRPRSAAPHRATLWRDRKRAGANVTTPPPKRGRPPVSPPKKDDE